MALEVKFNVCETPTCTKLEFSDETGAYNILTNPGGYDENNDVIVGHPATADFQTADLSVTTPSNVVYQFDLIPSLFPTIDLDDVYTINGTDLGYTDNKIVDGIYQFVYTLSTPLETYTVTKYILFTCQINCCIDKLYSKVTASDFCHDCKKPDYLKSAIEAEGYVCAAKNALVCGKISLVKTFLAKAQSICANLNCKCC